MRGTLEPALSLAEQRRFIPACAGNAILCLLRSKNYSVHPRVCGERMTGTQCAGARSGSSPRVRGTPADPSPVSRMNRFIPACAGNAIDKIIPFMIVTVHPRVCGERGFIRVLARTASGSSPRVRGTRHIVLSRYRPFRFIPACAGNA